MAAALRVAPRKIYSAFVISYEDLGSGQERILKKTRKEVSNRTHAPCNAHAERLPVSSLLYYRTVLHYNKLFDKMP